MIKYIIDFFKFFMNKKLNITRRVEYDIKSKYFVS